MDKMINSILVVIFLSFNTIVSGEYTEMQRRVCRASDVELFFNLNDLNRRDFIASKIEYEDLGTGRVYDAAGISRLYLGSQQLMRISDRHWIRWQASYRKEFMEDRKGALSRDFYSSKLNFIDEISGDVDFQGPSAIFSSLHELGRGRVNFGASYSLFQGLKKNGSMTESIQRKLRPFAGIYYADLIGGINAAAVLAVDHTQLNLEADPRTGDAEILTMIGLDKYDHLPPAGNLKMQIRQQIWDADIILAKKLFPNDRLHSIFNVSLRRMKGNSAAGPENRIKNITDNESFSIENKMIMDIKLSGDLSKIGFEAAEARHYERVIDDALLIPVLYESRKFSDFTIYFNLDRFFINADIGQEKLQYSNYFMNRYVSESLDFRALRVKFSELMGNGLMLDCALSYRDGDLDHQWPADKYYQGGFDLLIGHKLRNSEQLSYSTGVQLTKFDQADVSSAFNRSYKFQIHYNY